MLGLLQSRLGIDLSQLSPDPQSSGHSVGMVTFFIVAIALVVIAGLLFSSLRGQRAPPPNRAPKPAELQPMAAGDSDAQPIWFVIIQGSLEGPFSAAQLGDMLKRSVLKPGTQVRRRSESSWQLISDIVSSDGEIR